MAEQQLFVSNIPFTCSTEIFRASFGENSHVKTVRLVINPVSKQSRGTGFIVVDDIDTYKRFLDETEPVIIDGRRLKFSEYVNQKKFYKLHIRKVPESITNQELFTFFTKFGVLDNVKIDVNYKTNKSKGTATVVYNNYDDFHKVLSMQTIPFSDDVVLEVQKRRLSRRQQAKLNIKRPTK